MAWEENLSFATRLYGSLDIFVNKFSTINFFVMTVNLKPINWWSSNYHPLKLHGTVTVLPDLVSAIYHETLLSPDPSLNVLGWETYNSHHHSHPIQPFKSCLQGVSKELLIRTIRRRDATSFRCYLVSMLPHIDANSFFHSFWNLYKPCW